MDVDGTLTDGKLYIGDEGEMFKAFSVKDGFGIKNVLRKNEITPVIITGRESKIVLKRCEELGISHVYQGVENKREALLKVISDFGVSPGRVAYIGDDENDLECMEYLLKNDGVVGCPEDSALEVLKRSGVYHCKRRGGDGAVREFIQHIICDLSVELFVV